jgi:hypothetical protein
MNTLRLVGDTYGTDAEPFEDCGGYLNLLPKGEGAYLLPKWDIRLRFDARNNLTIVRDSAGIVCSYEDVGRHIYDRLAEAIYYEDE